MKSKSEILEFVAEYYGSNPSRRCFDNARQTSCYFRGETKCPFGLFMKNQEKLEKEYNGLHIVQLAYTLGSYSSHSTSWMLRRPCPEVDALLHDDFQGHPLGFWKDLQAFHDNHGLFSPEGLNARGKKFVNLLKWRWVASKTAKEEERNLQAERWNYNAETGTLIKIFRSELWQRHRNRKYYSIL